jgi:hypothetical protein
MKSQVSHTGRQAKPGNRKILVVANEIIEGQTLREAIGLRVGDEQPAEVRVIAPALNSRLRHWLSDEDGARRSAALRLAAELDSLSAAGIEADGQVGDADPLQAIADALYQFAAGEIVIATQPDRCLHWLTRDLVGRARRRFAQLIVHVVIEPNEDAKTGSASPTRLRQSPDTRRTAAAAALKASVYRIGALDCKRIEANG